MISIANTNLWRIQDGFRPTPYMRDLLLFAGQQDNYQSSCELVGKYLGVAVDDSQMHRLCQHYGTLLEESTQSLQQGIVEQAQRQSQELKPNETVYAMCDGCMLPTRPHQVEDEPMGSWKEMKLGRVFTEQNHIALKDKPSLIRESIYVSHFGQHKGFTDKFSVVLDEFERRNEQLVFINDGAVWIANFIKDYYPNATDILDFYHASEYVHEFGKAVFPKQERGGKGKRWINEQIILLLNDKVTQVIDNIEGMNLKGKTRQQAQEKIISYFQTNQHRMKYKTYRDRGLLIGSGPIESAHRFVLQKRMKQSGQKWTKKGGQAIANLRVFHLNNQWDKVIDLIHENTCLAA